jgi:hypothetical protein
MCRRIKQLRRPDDITTTGEVEAAALQFVRKLSGYRAPSARNAEAFDSAVHDIAHVAERLLEQLGVDVEEGPNKWTPGSGSSRRRPEPAVPA